MSLYQTILINLIVSKGKSERWAKDRTNKLPLSYLQISYSIRELADKIAKGK